MIENLSGKSVQDGTVLSAKHIDNPLAMRVKQELTEIKRAGLYRNVTDLLYTDATTAWDRQGNKFIVFSSNNYLGLTFDPRVTEAAAGALREGVGSTGSRLTTGGVFAASELERELARFKHAEAALLFNTGYMTNLGVLYGLARPCDTVFSDALNHASIIDGCRISRCRTEIYRHNDMNELEQKLQACETDVKIIVTDGVFSMDGDIANLPELVRLKEKYNAILIVDDAHAVGVLGKDGAGTASHYHLETSIDLQVGTLSKSLASVGGYVAGSKILIEYLRNKSRPFIFSTFLSPADTAAAKAALGILRTEGRALLQKLQRNTKQMCQLLRKAEIPISHSGVTPIIPILVGDAAKATKIDFALRERGILLSAIRPPTVAPGTSRLRLTVTAAHTEEQIVYTAMELQNVWETCMQK